MSTIEAPDNEMAGIGLAVQESTLLTRAIEHLEVALPPQGDGLEQDEEWIVVRHEGKWKRIRLHDYGDVFTVQGLYERWVYQIFQCDSPHEIRQLLERALQRADADPESLTVLDLGAGNGCVAEELSKSGIHGFVGVDIYDEAAEAAQRDRPGLYCDFVVCDLTNPDTQSARTLEGYDFNCMTCVAALGFGDIPPEVFREAFNRVSDGGWIAFTIKTDFLNSKDKSGFSVLIRRILDEGILELDGRETYRHRVSTDGQPLMYEAIVGRKTRDIP